VKVVVTGGGGFIGRATCVWLKREGHDVAVFDHTYGDDVLGSLHTLDDFEADAIIHLAGVLGTSELFSDVERAIDVNVKGTWRVLEWCLEHDARYVGSDLEVSRVRAFNAFGEGQKFGPDHPQKIIPTFATKAWLGEPIPVWGDGTQTVDLVDAEDVGRMLVDALRFGDDAVFDAGTGYALTVNAVAQLVLDVTGSTAGIEYLPMRAGETPTHIVATGDGWDRLTWSPKYSEDRLAEVIEWYHPSVVRE
jgi:UDP-glucose 4-epimerase